MKSINGILSALITPFDQFGEINHDMIRRLVRYQLGAGLTGFFVNGGTGEGLLLSPEERKAALETVIDETSGDGHVIAHIGALSTRMAADLATHAQAVGASAIAAIPPIYFRVDLAALHDHYRQIATAAPDTPLWLYNIPGATGVNVTAEMFAQLLTIPQVAGIKFTSYDFFTMRQMIELSRERGVTVLSGPDEMCLPALVMGSDGAIGTTYNILPGLYADLYRCYRDGDLAAAQEKQFQANRVIKAFTSTPSSIAAIKVIMKRMGFDCGVPRRPIRPLSVEENDLLQQQVDQSGFQDLIDLKLDN